MAAISPFPLPPRFYLDYTPENVAAGRAPPPPPPVEGPFSMFGMQMDMSAPLIRSLDEQNFPRLYPDNPDRIVEIQRLNKLLLAEYEALINDLTDKPQANREEVLGKLNTIFINMHHMINEFRPHQGHETVRAMMELQLKQRGDMKANIKKALEKVALSVRESIQRMDEELASAVASASTASTATATAADGEAAGSVSIKLEDGPVVAGDGSSTAMAGIQGAGGSASSREFASAAAVWQASDKDVMARMLAQFVRPA
eukprot:m.187866 g.187866  ORF g.187866 m.187866 type:complete len:257 (+) comp17528_c3_seq1:355-1125(+)